MAELAKKLSINKIIFENNLTPVQSYKIAQISGVEVIDRFQLILEIFSRRASTREAQLQIRLADLRRQLPRAKESVRLARRGEQPGFMGLGRYEVEVYFEAIKRQIAHVRRELKSFREKRVLQRTRRLELGFSLVSLAGYTNSGKSTLFNALTEESVPVGSGLFTTLSTTTRSISFHGRKMLVTDTVGFIDRLPLVLVEAFRSTLEETIFADAIILLVDANEPISDIKRKMNVCLNTIREIGAGSVPAVTALNKIDLITETELLDKVSRLKGEAPSLVHVSALKKLNLEKILEVIDNLLESLVEADFVLPVNDESMALISCLHDQCSDVKVEYEGKKVNLRLRANSWIIDRVKGQIEKLGGRMLGTVSIH